MTLIRLLEGNLQEPMLLLSLQTHISIALPRFAPEPGLLPSWDS